MINIGILGNGTVGSGILELIDRNRETLRNQKGFNINVTKVLVKDLEKHKKNKYFSLLTNDSEEFFNNEMDIVVEVMGGVNPAYDYMKKALKLKKHVVTANKDVISKYGVELLKTAREQGVTLNFEASVGGGMPIIKILSESLTGSNIESITGILNGTTNFILSKMYNENIDYANALKTAQELGFAEADPSSDVLGLDAARKLAIASSISYGETLDWEKIKTQGIDCIDETDILCAKKVGGTIKLLAMSKRDKEGIYASVRPVIIPKSSSLGKLENEFNGVALEGDTVGEIFLSGKGAGKLPTASAVLADILSIIESNKRNQISLGQRKACIENEYMKKASWLVRISHPERKNVINEIANTFKNFFLFSSTFISENELIVYVECEDERLLNSWSEKLLDDKKCISVKTTLCLQELNYASDFLV